MLQTSAETTGFAIGHRCDSHDPTGLWAREHTTLAPSLLWVVLGSWNVVRTEECPGPLPLPLWNAAEEGIGEPILTGNKATIAYKISNKDVSPENVFNNESHHLMVIETADQLDMQISMRGQRSVTKQSNMMPPKIHK